MTAEERQVRSDEADELCRRAWAAAGADPSAGGMALVAVGGYGRRELAPYSDLDLVLVHAPDVEVGEVAATLWYPLWDARAVVDHSVRALDEVTRAAAADVRVALGLLDARHVAGDPSVSLRLRADVLAAWRRNARSNLPRLRDLVLERAARVGELADSAVPDLKESYGGLRDATVLKAMVATWLVDVPHSDLERCRRQLLDIRDVVHGAAGRASDRVAPELWRPLAEALGLPDEAAGQRLVRQLGRRVVHLSRVTWSRVDHVLAPVRGVGHGRTPGLVQVAPGIAVSAGEIVLDRGADPARDPLLLLRAAAEAAERGLMVAPATAARLADRAAPLPTPWPDEALRLLVRLLAAGPGLLPVWETLDETAALERLLPEWDRIRLLPHASAVHRFTVDRHVVETCIEASRLIRQVRRPDILLVSALLHDIGKGATDRSSASTPVGPGRGHAVAGEPVAAAIASRMGFDESEAATVARLVRWHLLLPETATSRNLEDPATVAFVVDRVHDRSTLDLLEVLTEADAKATSGKAWTAWRETLVRDLVHRARDRLGGGPEAEVEESPDEVVVPDRVRADPRHIHVEVVGDTGGARVSVIAQDRHRFVAAVAGALTVLRMSVRSARAWTVDDVAVTIWDVDEGPADVRVLAQRIEAVLGGVLDPARRLQPTGSTSALPPSVLVHPDASRDATVLEVRTQDRRGVVYLACEALAELGLEVRSAHVATLGPQALDVFYIQEPGGVPLAEERAATAVHAVRRALGRAVTLDA